MRASELRGTIFAELQSTYSKDKNTNWWSPEKDFTFQTNKDLTSLILAEIIVKDEDELLVRRITNIIWMVWTGGTTAENCAQRIINKIGSVL